MKVQSVPFSEDHDQMIPVPCIRARHHMKTFGDKQCLKPAYGAPKHHRTYLALSNHRVAITTSFLEEKTESLGLEERRKLHERIQGRHERLVNHRARRKAAKDKTEYKWLQ